MVDFADVPADSEAEFGRWHDTHHFPERLGVPGVLAAIRYEAYVGEPKHLRIIELTDAAVLKHPQMGKLSDRVRDWERALVPPVKIIESAVYERIFELGAPPERHASRAITVRFDPPSELEGEFNDWYNTDHMPGLLSVPGMYCGRRYRKLSGSGARYLALYEYDDEKIQTTEAWAKAAYTDWSKSILPRLGAGKLVRHRRIHEASAG